MPNNPVQAVLNTNKFIVRPEPTAGGSTKDFFAGRDEEFAAHKGQLLGELGQIRQQIERVPELGIEYAHVQLQSDAWAKSWRPIERVFPVKQVPLIGGGSLGELLVELTVENIPLVQKAIERAENRVKYGLNKKDEQIPKPTRNRSEVGSIERIRAHQPQDRRAFSAEEAVQWLANPRTGGMYVVESFVDLLELEDADPRRQRARAALRRFLGRLSEIQLPLERLEPSPRLSGHRLLFLRLRGVTAAPSEGLIAQHQRLLEFLDHEPAVRRILLPPVIEASHATQGAPQAAVELTAPSAGVRHPVVGIIDTGVARLPALEAWCAGRTDFVGNEAGQDRSHGTFIAGLASAGAELNSHALYSEQPCKFYDLALYATEDSAFQAFYPRGFLDFLEQLEVELAAAKAAGARVFNMSLGLERQVRDDSYGFFASLIDSIADAQDILLVLPSGNLERRLWRGEWSDDPNEVLRMLAEYRHAGSDRILQPTESVRAVVAGAVNPPTCATAPLRPATYTRRGPSAALGTKPDVAHIGGRGEPQHELASVDLNGNRVEGCGTSYAAPLVAKILAVLDTQIEGDVTRETLIALLAHHAAPPKELRIKALERVARDFIGFGIPLGSSQMLETGDHLITLLFAARLAADRELVFPFSWPATLVNSKGQCRGRVRLTLVYRPPIDPRFDAEFVRINLDAHLRQEKLDKETGEVTWEGQLRSETDKRYERELIEHGQKWWPVKRYERVMKGVGTSSQWRLVVEGLARSGMAFPAAGVSFSLLLTIEDPRGNPDVFREMRQGLLTAGARIADVRTANRVGARI
jgi:hypothetical protein